MVIGNKSKIKTLRALLEANAIPQSILLWGPEHIGKRLIAEELAKGLVCQNRMWGGGDKCPSCFEFQHAHISRDIFIVDQTLRQELKKLDDNNPERIDIYNIKGARKIIAFLDEKPTFGNHKVVIIDDAHLLNPDAQNALLKTIEEPYPYAHIIFITHKPIALLETVLSRVMQLSFGLVDRATMETWLKKMMLQIKSRAVPYDRSSAEVKSDEKKIRKAITYSLLRPGKAYELLAHELALGAFEQIVNALLNLEQKPLGQKLALISLYAEKQILTDPSLFALWQIVLRDELLFSLGMKQYTLLLTKKHNDTPIACHTRALRTSIELERAAENAPSAIKSAVELLAGLL